MKVMVVITSDLSKIAEQLAGPVAIPWALTTPISPMQLAQRHQAVQCRIDVMNSEPELPRRVSVRNCTVKLIHHSSVLAGTGSGFVSDLSESSTGARQRELARYPRITFQDIKAIVERSINVVDDVSVEIVYLDSTGGQHPIPLGDSSYIIDTSTITVPKDYANFIGATKYMQSYFVLDNISYVRHEFVDIAGRLWMHVCEEKAVVKSSEADIYPADWGTRIIYSKQEQLNG